jgi:hypothetical protein
MFLNLKVGCGWFGIQTHVGGQAIYAIVRSAVWEVCWITRGLGFHGYNLGFHDSNLGFHGSNLGFRGSNLRFRGSNLRFRGSNLGFRGSIFWVSWFKFRISWLKFRVSWCRFWVLQTVLLVHFAAHSSKSALPVRIAAHSWLVQALKLHKRKMKKMILTFFHVHRYTNEKLQSFIRN